MHEADLMPATLPKRSTHPDLCNGMENAVLTPDFERPARPTNAPLWWTVPIIASMMFTLSGLLFDVRNQ